MKSDGIDMNSYKEKSFISFLFFMFCFLLFRPALDNDTFWLLNTGKYILKNGIPLIEPFTIHEGLKFIPQQWMTTVLFYYIYENFGKTGLYGMAFGIYLVIIYMMYKVSVVVSKQNYLISAKLVIFACIPLSFFVALRPQLISMLIFITEIYCLELFVATRKKNYLLPLPVLSALLINFHAAFWIFFFVIIFPYILDGLKFKKSFIECQGYGIKAIIVAVAASFIAGLINPFGFESMAYIFKSYGYSNINSYIQEMQSPDFKNRAGIFIFCVYLAVITLYLLKKESSSRLRYTLITLGTAYMGLSSIRSFMLFVICSIPLVAYYYKDSFGSKMKFGEERYFKQKIWLLIILMVLGNYLKFTKLDFNISNDYAPVQATKFINEKIDKSTMRLFNEYNEGAYLEFVGIKTFIDPRAEVFLKANNEKEDILNDYFDAITGKMHYEKLAEKYELTHFLVSKGTLMDVYLMTDGGYRLIYADKAYKIFEHNNRNRSEQ